MEHGTTLLAILHIIVAVILVTIVLLQDSKGGGMGGSFGGGGGSQTLFGATGAANFLVKVTRSLAVIFMCTCVGLTVLLSRRTSHSVVDTLPRSSAPSAPGATGAVPAPAAPVPEAPVPEAPTQAPAGK